MAAKIYRTTTPVLILKVTNQEFDMNEIDKCHVTLESKNGQERVIIESPEIDKEERAVKAKLTEEQTSSLSVGIIKIQMKVKLNNGDVFSTKVIEGNVMEILEEEFL